jgi:hypothetical protein
MTTEELLPSVKKWLRIMSVSLDDEISQTISACVVDLKNAGVRKVKLDNPLIQQAVKLYCKAQFGYDDTSSKFAKSYELLKQSLSLSGEYNMEDT